MKNRIHNSFVPAFGKRAGSQPSFPTGQPRTFIVCRRAAGDTSFDVPVMPASQPASRTRTFNLLTLESLMKTKLGKISRALGAALFCTTAVCSTHAGTHTWHGEGFFSNKTLVWSDPFNWAEGAPAAGEANLVLIFPPDTDTYVTNDIAGLVVEQIQITGTNYVLHGVGGGTSLTLLGSGPLLLDLNLSGANNSIAPSLSLVLSNTVTVSIPTNKSFTVRSIISGTGGLDKGGPGTLVLQTAGLNNTYTGLTSVRNGRLQLNQGNALAIPGNLTIGEAGGTAPCEVRFGNSFPIGNGSVVTIYTNGSLNTFGYNDTVGSLNLYGGEVLTDIGTLTLNGNITTTGYPQIYGNVGFGALTRTINNLNGGLYADATFTGLAGVGINKTGSGYTDLVATNQITGLVTVEAGTLFVGHSGALGTTGSGTVVSNGASIYINSFTTVTGEPLTVQGNGDSTFGAVGFGTDADWNGDVNLPADTLTYVLSTSGSSTINGIITGTGKLIKRGAGTLMLGGPTFNSNSGGVEVVEGGLGLNKPANQYAVLNSLIIGTNNGPAGSAWATLFAGNEISDFATVDIRGSGWLNSGNNYETVGGLTGSGQLNLGTAFFSVGTGGIGSSFAGNITGSGSTNLVKIGAGTLTLTGNSSVSGRTVVGGGQLIVEGSLASSPITVASGGTLGGSGLVGSVTVETGGTLSPGASPGQLGISGSLAMTLGSYYVVELNGLQAGSTYDQVVASGSINLGNATLSLSLGVPTAVSNYWMIVSKSTAGAITGTFNGLPENSVVVAGNRKFRITYVGGNGNDIFLTQDNSVPQIQTLNAPAAWPEGSALSLTGTYLEPDSSDTVKLVVDWGDGAVTTNNVGGGAFSLQHTYADDNPSNTPQDEYTIAAFPLDNNGGKGPTIGRFPMITNVPPTYTPPVGAALLPGQALSTTLAISDAGTDTFQAYVNYGAGGGAPAVPVVGNLLNLNYTYPSNGTYTVTMLVRDDDLGESLKSFDVLVGLKLNIADAANNQVKLSWPGTAQNLFVEGQSDVGGTNWSVVPIAPTLAGDEYYINVPKTNAVQFFRLGWDPNAQ